MMRYEVCCRYCKRHIGYAVGIVMMEGLICPNSKCKARLNIKVINKDGNDEQRKYRFSEKEYLPKKESDK